MQVAATVMRFTFLLFLTLLFSSFILLLLFLQSLNIFELLIYKHLCMCFINATGMFDNKCYFIFGMILRGVLQWSFLSKLPFPSYSYRYCSRSYADFLVLPSSRNKVSHFSLPCVCVCVCKISGDQKCHQQEPTHSPIRLICSMQCVHVCRGIKRREKHKVSPSLSVFIEFC